jgi:hypothetical protein
VQLTKPAQSVGPLKMLLELLHLLIVATRIDRHELPELVELQLLKQKMTLHFLVAEEQRINLQTPLLIISLECYRPQRRGEKLYQNVYICTVDINVHIMYVIICISKMEVLSL